MTRAMAAAVTRCGRGLSKPAAASAMRRASSRDSSVSATFLDFHQITTYTGSMKAVSLVLIIWAGLSAAELPPPDREIPLYEGVAPGSEKWDWNERTVSSASG